MKNVQVQILFGSGRLTPFKREIQVILSNTLETVAHKVTLSNIDIVVHDNPKSTIEAIGIGGYTSVPHIVNIYLDPTFKRFRETIKKNLGRTLAHELHHTIRARKIGYGNTLLQAMVSEGLADHFDIEISQEKPYPWDAALTSNQRERLMRRAMKLWHRKTYDHSAWFFGTKPKEIPRWTGYSLGVQSRANILKEGF
jgi:uncharacterized protein YjaZ